MHIAFYMATSPCKPFGFSEKCCKRRFDAQRKVTPVLCVTFFVFKEHVLFRVDFLSVTSDCSFFFHFLFFTESFVVEQQALFRVDFIHISMVLDIKVQC